MPGSYPSRWDYLEKAMVRSGTPQTVYNFKLLFAILIFAPPHTYCLYYYRSVRLPNSCAAASGASGAIGFRNDWRVFSFFLRSSFYIPLVHSTGAACCLQDHGGRRVFSNDWRVEPTVFTVHGRYRPPRSFNFHVYPRQYVATSHAMTDVYALRKLWRHKYLQLSFTSSHLPQTSISRCP